MPWDGGGGTWGSPNVVTARATHPMAAVKPARVEASAPMALIKRHPAIQPKVPKARTGPNSRVGSRRPARAMEVRRLQVGVAKRA